MSTSSKVRVAILDDYQRVALTSTDWSSVENRLVIDVFSDTISTESDLVARLQPYAIICAMRERTKFDASLLDKLPNLKFIATTGERNAAIDISYAASKKIVVSGTGQSGNPTLEHIWALILGTAKHLVVEDRNMKAGNEQWQSTVSIGLAERTLGLIGVGRLGMQTAKVRTFVSTSCITAKTHSCIVRSLKLLTCVSLDGPQISRQSVRRRRVSSIPILRKNC